MQNYHSDCKCRDVEMVVVLVIKVIASEGEEK